MTEVFGVLPTTSAAGDVAKEGEQGASAKADHRHGREAVDANLGGTPTNSAVGDVAATGTATTGSHSDHRHGREAFAAPGSSAVGDAAAAGTATTVPHSDHQHGREAYETAPAAVATAAAAGTATTVPHGDHVHALGTTFPRGRLAGITKITSNQTTITATVDITGSSLTPTFAASRRYRFTCAGQGCFSTVATDTYIVFLVINGANYHAQRMPISSTTTPTTGFAFSTEVLADGSAAPDGMPSGAITCKLTIARSTGTGTLTLVAATGGPTDFFIEDIGT